EAWRQTLQDTYDWLTARGIAYLFVVPPDKHQVYPEEMPDSIRRNGHSRIDQLVHHLAAHTTVPVLDLRPALHEAKMQERVYHMTDTHWNDRGAYVGYARIMSALARDVPALAPVPRTMFEARAVRTDGL